MYIVPPEVGNAEQISAKDPPTHSTNVTTRGHPYVVEAGPPWYREAPYSPEIPVITEMIEKLMRPLLMVPNPRFSSCL